VPSGIEPDRHGHTPEWLAVQLTNGCEVTTVEREQFAAGE
jgi:hypothetical protein